MSATADDPRGLPESLHQAPTTTATRHDPNAHETPTPVVSNSLTRSVAVKVINHLGDEVMKVFKD